MRHLPPRLLWAVLLALLCVIGRAWAQTPEGPSVSRNAGAESCPDGAALGARIAHVRGRPADSDASAYAVEFSRQNGDFSAQIRRLDGSTGARVLKARESSCRALAQAVAVAVALLLDSSAGAPVDVTPPTAPAETVEPATNVPEPAPRPEPVASPAQERDVPRAHVPTRLLLSAGAGLIAGVLRPVVPAFLASFGLVRAALRAELGALTTYPMNVSLAPGHLRESLQAGFVRACAAPVRAQALRLDACTGALAGVTRAHALGFSRNHRRHAAWAALPAELALAYLPARFGVELDAGALFPLKRRDFSINGLGAAYHSWPVSLQVALRLLVVWP
jgi:hypothetical protein